MRFLVVGVGSIGARHCRNLVTLGHEALAWDADPARLAEAVATLGIRAVSGLEAGLGERPHGVLVCTPPATHVGLARRALEADAHVFVEKPIAASSEEVPDLLDLAKRRQRVLAVGFNLRFLPSLARVKSFVDGGRIGRVHGARAEFGFFLPDWRTGADYRQNYGVSRALGGGILLDAIHELDYLDWLFGAVTEVCCVADHVSDLAGDTEDLAELTLAFASGVLGQVHLDYLRRAYRRSLEVLGSEGVLTWEYPSRVVTVQGPDPERVERHEPTADGPAEAMYLEELSHFVRCIKGRERPAVDGETALRSLRLVEAAKVSAARRAWVVV
jgi:predicted dehydrogenase